MSERQTGEAISSEAMWYGPALRLMRADLADATAILRAILAADERGQGQPFAEAMDRARAFVERLG